MIPLLPGVRDRFRIGRGRRRADHLTERRLLALIDGEGEADDRIHLEDCPDCQDRLRAMHAFLDGLRREAETACDEALSPARLAAGRRRIRRRVERVAGCDGPRVLRFPAPTRPRSDPPARSRWWLGAAAAAGLAIGLTVGRFDARLDVGGTDAPAGPAPVGTAATRPADLGSHAADELFMQELERLLTSPRIPPLVALDELTPRLREVGVDVR